MAIALSVPTAAVADPRLDLARRLARLLPQLRPATIQTLADTARIRDLRPGDAIYAQDEPVPITLILEGNGIAKRTTLDGHELVSGIAPAGIVFGYSGIGGQRSSVALVAIGDAVVAQWPGAEIRALIAADPEFGLIAIDSMGATVHGIIEGIEGFLHQDSRRRVLRILARHRELFFTDPPVLNRAHLPALVGTTKEMTRRALRQLEREGTLERVGSTGLRLLRPERLDS